MNYSPAAAKGVLPKVRELAEVLDWSGTALGPRQYWPQALSQCFSLCLDSPILMAVYWGPEFCMLYGDAYAPWLAEKHPAALGHTARQVWAEVWPVIEPQLQRVMATGEGFVTSSQRFDILQHGVLREKYFSYSFMPIRDAEGRVAGVFNTAHETTAQIVSDRERNSAETSFVEELRQSAQTRDLLQALSDGTSDVVYIKDVNGRFLHVNKTFGRLFGLSSSEILGQDDTSLMPTAQAAVVMANDRAVMDSRETHTLEEVVQIAAQGGPVTRIYLSTKSPWIAPDGKLLGVFGISRDITERKAQEDVLRDLNATLEAKVAERTLERDRIWRVSREIFIVCRFDGVLLSVNPANERVLGWTFDESVQRPIMERVHPDDAAATQAEFEKAIVGTAVEGFECRLLHRDGSYRWLNWTAVAEGELLYAVGRDVSSEHAHRATLSAAEEQLRQAQKMEAVGQLTGGIAHDFNNLLATIMTSLELLERRAHAGRVDELQRFIGTAKTSTQRAASLTQRLLAFSRRQALDPQAVDVNKLVSSMEELMLRTLGENVQLRLMLGEGLPAARTDTNQLENALLNLAINARDAMPQGGILTIATEVGIIPAAEITASDTDLNPGQYLKLSVSDTGLGMSPGVISKAFDPFFTTKPIGKGTGLGLSMIYGYAKQSGGHVTISSRPGEGARVNLYLPLHAGESQVQIPESKALPLLQGDGKAVLLVEDEAALRVVMLEVLSELGYSVFEAQDASSAMRLVDSAVHMDLMVSDVGLPGINGRQLAEMVRAKRNGLKVLFVTGYAGHAAERGDFLDDGMDMLSKPFTMDELAKKMEDMLHGDLTV